MVASSPAIGGGRAESGMAVKVNPSNAPKLAVQVEAEAAEANQHDGEKRDQREQHRVPAEQASPAGFVDSWSVVAVSEKSIIAGPVVP